MIDDRPSVEEQIVVVLFLVHFAVFCLNMYMGG